jgi:2-octaprenyl-6-methoxyphenol hydroxylase
MERVDGSLAQKVVVVGAGPVGMLCALFLKKNISAIDPILCDPFVDRSIGENDLRAFALTAQTKHLLEDLGLWSRIEAVEPIVAMRITDSQIDHPARRPLLIFDEPLRTGECFAYMVPHRALIRVLKQACFEMGLMTKPVRVQRFEPTLVGQSVTFCNNETLECSLVIGADGANSHVRTMAGLAWIHYAYDQSALVATIEHKRAHGGVAVQHFFPQGSFAQLPLYGGYCSSLVWVESPEVAEGFLSYDERSIEEEIEKRLGGHLGSVRLISSLRAYPLKFGIARSFVSYRCALIGDSAHIIHPLAGQGVNLGFQDVLTLGRILKDSVNTGIDCGHFSVLKEYEKSRYSHTTALWLATEGLNRLFSSANPLARAVRETGLRFVDSLEPLKRILIHQAAGTF